MSNHRDVSELIAQLKDAIANDDISKHHDQITSCLSQLVFSSEAHDGYTPEYVDSLSENLDELYAVLLQLATHQSLRSRVVDVFSALASSTSRLAKELFLLLKETIMTSNPITDEGKFIFDVQVPLFKPLALCVSTINMKTFLFLKDFIELLNRWIDAWFPYITGMESEGTQRVLDSLDCIYRALRLISCKGREIPKQEQNTRYVDDAQDEKASLLYLTAAFQLIGVAVRLPGVEELALKDSTLNFNQVNQPLQKYEGAMDQLASKIVSPAFRELISDAWYNTLNECIEEKVIAVKKENEELGMNVTDVEVGFAMFLYCIHRKIINKELTSSCKMVRSAFNSLKALLQLGEHQQSLITCLIGLRTMQYTMENLLLELLDGQKSFEYYDVQPQLAILTKMMGHHPNEALRNAAYEVFQSYLNAIPDNYRKKAIETMLASKDISTRSYALQRVRWEAFNASDSRITHCYTPEEACAAALNLVPNLSPEHLVEADMYASAIVILRLCVSKSNLKAELPRKINIENWLATVEDALQLDEDSRESAVQARLALMRLQCALENLQDALK